jgi:hypothetical protein
MTIRTPMRSDGDAIVAEALRRLEQPLRRRFLSRGLTLGGLAMLSGCSLVDDRSVDAALMKVSRWNDGVQGWLFDPSASRRPTPTR